MIHVRKSKERGHLNFGWLDTYHSFSFGSYFDPNFMGFRNLRVINQDTVEPTMGFDTHPHKDMEIITYVTQGTVEHQDSLGTRQQIGAGQIQVMSAGTGIRHSEFNPSDKIPLQLLQIWVLPNEKNLKPRYSDLTIPLERINNQLGLIVSPDGQEQTAMIHQDVFIYASKTNKEKTLTHELKPQRHAWIQIVQGQFKINGVTVEAGDGIAISEETQVVINSSSEPGEFLLFDLN